MGRGVGKAELRRLSDANTPAEWRAACEAIKARNGGTYPADFIAVVVESGLMGKVHARMEKPRLTVSAKNDQRV